MIKKYCYVCTLIVVLSIGLWFVHTDSAYAVSVYGPYTIKTTLASNKCVALTGGKLTNDTNICLWKTLSGAYQDFYFYSEGDDYYSIRPYENTNMALDISGGKAYNGANVILYEYHGGNNQLWKVYSAGNSGQCMIKSKCGNYYLDVSGGGTANNTNIQVYTRNDSNAQKWDLVSPYSVKKAIEYAQRYTDNSGSMGNNNSVYNMEYNIYKQINPTDYKGYDCTNFVSQCLYAGGIVETSEWKRVLRGQSIGDDQARMTWVRAKYLYNYLTNRLHFKAKKLSGLRQICKGDIVFYTKDGEVHHATICTGMENGDPYFCAHSSWRKNFLYSKTNWQGAIVVHIPGA